MTYHFIHIIIIKHLDIFIWTIIRAPIAISCIKSTKNKVKLIFDCKLQYCLKLFQKETLLYVNKLNTIKILYERLIIPVKIRSQLKSFQFVNILTYKALA